MEPALGALRVFASPPAWLFAAADGGRVAAALDAELRAVGGPSLQTVDCRLGDLRLRGRDWEGRYEVTLDGPEGRWRLTLAAVLSADGSAAVTRQATVSVDDPSWSVTLSEPPLTLSHAGIDRKLPALATLTDPGAARAWLQRHLVGMYPGICIDGCDPVVARYRPGQRAIVICSLRYDAMPDPTWPAIVVAKVNRRGRGAHEYGALQAVAAAGAARRGALRFARPLAYVPGDDVSVQSHLPQDRGLVQLIEVAAIAGDPASASTAVAAVSGALVELHGSRTHFDGGHDLGEEIASVRGAAATLETLVPGATAAIEPVLGLVEHRARDVPADAVVPSHGAFRPAQVRLAGESVGLLDLDSFGLCEPAQDVGRFVAKLRLVALRAAADSGPAHTTADVLAAAFLDRYTSERDVSADRVLLWETLDLLKALLQSWSRARPAQLPSVLTLLDDCVRRLR